MYTTPKIIIRDYSKNADGLSMLYLQCFINSKRVRIPLEILCKAAHFDKKTGRINKKDANYHDRNLLLGKLEAHANKIFIDTRLDDEVLTCEIFKRKFQNPDSDENFIKFFERTLKHRRDITKSTFKAQNAVLQKLAEYKPNLSFKELDERFLTNYKLYLEHQLNNKPYTIWSSLKIIKVYLRFAKKERIKFDNPFDNYKVSIPKPVADSLSEYELEALQTYFKSPAILVSHRRTLKPFLFACHTGLRISDVRRMTTANLSNGILKFEEYKNRKLHKDVLVPLDNYALELIAGRETNLFDMATDQKINEALKEIAIRVGINKRLHFHMARHTFGSLSISRGMQPYALKEMMGHSKFETTQIYIHTNADNLKEQIKVWNEKKSDMQLPENA